MRQRQYFADVEQHNPEALDTLVRAEVAALHGTRSSTLGSMLEFGGKLQSATALEAEAGFRVGGGDSRSGVHQDRISFSAMTRPGATAALNYSYSQHMFDNGAERLSEKKRDIDDALAAGEIDLDHNIARAERSSQGIADALAYARDHPDSDFAALLKDDFPVVFGATRRAVLAVDPSYKSDPEEFYVHENNMDEIQPARSGMTLGEDLPVVGVPRERTAKVMAMLARNGYAAHVVALEDLAPLAPR
jgi:hypothetical protein